MPRLSILCALLVLTVASVASAAEGRTARGLVVAVTAKAIAVKDAKGEVTRCARADRSPSLDSYARGDRVQIVCAGAHGHLVLVKARKLEATETPANDSEPVTFGGTVTALTDGSITVHDGDRDLTCKLGDASPALGEVKVGTHVKVACANGVLVHVAVVVIPAPAPVPPAPVPPAPTPSTATGAAGTLTALTDASITVHSTEKGTDLTCHLGNTSPRLGDFHVGDHVGIACLDGTLIKIAKLA